MTVPDNVRSFYARARWGNLWHIKGPLYGPDGHRGHDLKAAARQDVPALRAGTVEYVGRSSVLGPVVVIKVGNEDYDGYAHLYGVDVKVGDKVSQGEVIAQTAGVKDDHGSAWLGPHLHITNGAYPGSVYSGATRNPANVIGPIVDAPVIVPAAVTKPAPAPAPATASPAPTTKKRDHDMYLLRITSGEVYLMTSRGRVQLTHPSHIVLFQRMFNAYPGFDTFNAAERDIMTSYILRAA
jgi:hypothetical protein